MEFFGDEIERITDIDVLTGEIKSEKHSRGDLSRLPLCGSPGADQTGSGRHTRGNAGTGEYFKGEDKLIEAQRIAERTGFDVEMMKETGFCSGIENYSRILQDLRRVSRPIL